MPFLSGHMVFCQTDSHAGIPLDQEAFYVRRFLLFFSRVFDEIIPFFSSTQAKTHLQFHDMTHPFVKQVDLRQVGLTMSNKKA